MALVIALPLRSLGEESRGGLPREETGFHLRLIVGFHERQDLVGRYQPRRPAKVQLTDQVRITRRLETERRRPQARALKERIQPRLEQLRQRLHATNAERVLARKSKLGK